MLNFEKVKSLEIALSPAQRMLVRPVARRMLAKLRGHTAASMTYLNQFNCTCATSTLFSISPLQQMNNCSAQANRLAFTRRH